jgi:DNA-binding transcriptional MerR regulator
MSNGYKQYQVRHLVRLLQIRRLRDLGVPLDQIEQVGSDDGTAVALQAIDADLAASIERLQRARAEIKAVLEGSSVTNVPSGFEDVADRLSTSERSLMLIYSQLYDTEAMADLREMVQSEPEDAAAEFETLAADADEDTRQQLAERYAPIMAKYIDEYPWLTDQVPHLSKSEQVSQETFIESVVALYNPAQVDVMGRASVLATKMREQPKP